VPVDRLSQAVDVLLELPSEPRLPDSGWATDHDQSGRRTLDTGVEQILDQSQLHRPAGERCLEAIDALCPTHPGQDSDRPPQLLRQRLAPQRKPADLVEPDCSRRQPTGGGVDEHVTGRGRRLHPSGGVDRIAGDHPLTDRADGDRYIAGDDTRAGSEIRCTHLVTECRHGCDQVQACSYRPFGVSLQGDGGAPDSHDRVTDELLDRAAIALHHGACGREIA
jgi:hypothetical protein